MGDLDAGSLAARRVIAGASGFLVTAVAVVTVAFLASGEQGGLPLWYHALGWWSAALTVALALAAPILRERALRVGAGAAVVSYLAVVALFPVAAEAGHVERMPWLLTASSAGVAAALVAAGPGLGWVTVVLAAVAGVIYRLRFGGFDLDGVVNDAHAVLTAAVICALGGFVLSAGRGLDAAAAARREAGERESAERGRLAARTRTAALVHDEVLATLALAASTVAVPLDRLAAQARRAALMVTRLAHEESEDSWPLEAALAREARRHDARFTARVDSPLHVSDPVREAIVGACRQALANAVRHAEEAPRSVTLTVRSAMIEVVVADEGAGFEVSDIAADRLGIRHSIVGRMARVNGGSAEVQSGHGTGTRVVLRYRPDPGPEMDADASGRPRGRAVALLAAGFVALQVLCAVAAALAAPESWPRQAALLSVVLLTASLVWSARRAAPAWPRAAAITALVVGGTVVAVSTAPFSYGPLWPVVALAFFLVVLALRGRTGTAMAGAVLIAIVVAARGILDGALVGQTVQLAARPTVIVIVAVAMLLVVARMRRRIAALHREAVIAAESESWSRAARAELGRRTDELVRTVVPLMERIGAGSPASAAQRREYAAWEGRLRDELRAGGLSREPLRSAVGAARGRGVDVVLLDDSGESIDEDALVAVLAWMAAAVGEARHDVVGRLHPPHRAMQASIAVDGRVSLFDGALTAPPRAPR
ncbi:hypothetical protein MMX123_00062 [Microbacterium sp. MM2322]|uniref:sensor histidine kinase n=1 Tax=Microbacterium sp. MM2322 TaxID=3157631 RepID=UPI003D807237